MFGNSQLDEIEAPHVENCVFDPKYLTQGVKLTFFYQRVNTEGELFGDIFACGKREADLIARNEHKGQYRQLGVGDGKTFVDYIRKCGIRTGAVIPIAKANEILKAAWDAEFAAAKGKRLNARNDKIHRYIDPSMMRAENGMAAVRDFLGGDVEPENLIGHAKD